MRCQQLFTLPSLMQYPHHHQMQQLRKGGCSSHQQTAEPARHVLFAQWVCARHGWPAVVCQNKTSSAPEQKAREAPHLNVLCHVWTPCLHAGHGGHWHWPGTPASFTCMHGSFPLVQVAVRQGRHVGVRLSRHCARILEWQPSSNANSPF